MSLAATVDPHARREPGRRARSLSLGVVSLDGMAPATSCGLPIPVDGAFVPARRRDCSWCVAAFNVLTHATRRRAPGGPHRRAPRGDGRRPRGRRLGARPRRPSRRPRRHDALGGSRGVRRALPARRRAPRPLRHRRPGLHRRRRDAGARPHARARSGRDRASRPRSTSRASTSTTRPAPPPTRSPCLARPAARARAAGRRGDPRHGAHLDQPLPVRADRATRRRLGPPARDAVPRRGQRLTRRLLPRAAAQGGRRLVLDTRLPHGRRRRPHRLRLELRLRPRLPPRVRPLPPTAARRAAQSPSP